ncbi:MAG: BPL-N domain-containing protein [Vulcanimicrobiota bacterium]
MRRWLLLLICWLPVWVGAQNWESMLSPYEQTNLKKNRAWIAQRQSQGESSQARVAVLAGAGVWNFGARCLVTALERSGTACQVIDPANLPALDRYEALILPGGYAPVQYYGLGYSGCQKVAEFTRNGGHVLGICAGGYLVSKTVRYQNVDYPYPLGLFDGAAEGPVAGLPVYPSYGPVQLSLTPAGQEFGLGGLEKRSLLYGSGPRFVGGTQVTVLLTYPDGSAASISRPYGKGRLVALGAHLECPPNLDEQSAPPAGCEKILLKLLGL